MGAISGSRLLPAVRFLDRVGCFGVGLREGRGARFPRDDLFHGASPYIDPNDGTAYWGGALALASWSTARCCCREWSTRCWKISKGRTGACDDLTRSADKRSFFVDAALGCSGSWHAAGRWWRLRSSGSASTATTTTRSSVLPTGSRCCSPRRTTRIRSRASPFYRRPDVANPPRRVRLGSVFLAHTPTHEWWDPGGDHVLVRLGQRGLADEHCHAGVEKILAQPLLASTPSQDLRYVVADLERALLAAALEGGFPQPRAVPMSRSPTTLEMKGIVGSQYHRSAPAVLLVTATSSFTTTVRGRWTSRSRG